MNVSELREKIEELLPITQEEDDFRDSLKKALDSYLEYVRSLDENIFSNPSKKDIISKIETLTETIKETVRLYYAGRHSDAYQSFQKQMNEGGVLKEMALYPVKTTDEFSPNKSSFTIFYRARKFEGKEYSQEEMFHIPLDSRGIVSTQRFSFPGYPCLYLGKTIYDCWEELDRPDRFMVSGFRVHKAFNLYDLRVPSSKNYETNLSETILRVPLVIACQVKVKNKKDTFKPEYIIPQLLIETIISNNKKKIEDEKNKKKGGSYWGPDDLNWGFIYTSTHINKDSPYDKSFLENIALPVIESSNTEGLCNVLKSHFSISKPFERQHIKIDKLPQSYEKSEFGLLEKEINESDSYKEFVYWYQNGPKSITFPAEGGIIQLSVKSNTEWKIT